MVQVQVCWYKGQRHKTTTVKHHGPDNQGLFPCLPAFCKKAANSNKHHNPWICWRCHAKKIWPHRWLKTVQNSSVQGFWHMMNGFTVRLPDANSVEEHLCLRSPKHCHQTGDQNPEQSDQVDHLMSCQSREKPGSCPKQKNTIMRTPGYGSKMIRPLGYRMIRIMIYALLTCHNWGEKWNNHISRYIGTQFR